MVVHRALGDNEADYDVVVHASGYRVLRKENNRCVYLGETGCTIWERAPAVCRETDCRVIVRLNLPTSKDVYEAGRRLIAYQA